MIAVTFSAADVAARARLPLQGRRIVVTRPSAQAQGLAESIAQAGGVPLLLPLMEIEPTEKQDALKAALARLADFDYAVFVSPNAVAQTFAALGVDGQWPQDVRAVAMGETSAAALRSHGVREVVMPADGSDSEALLASPVFSWPALSDKAVLIFRGDGGRELLGETLAARGARVEYVECYRRRPATQGAAPMLALWRAQGLDAITLTSSESLRNLLAIVAVAAADDMVGEGVDWLQRTPLFAGHRRIADEARRLGFATVVATAPGDAGLLQGLIAYFGPERKPA